MAMVAKYNIYFMVIGPDGRERRIPHKYNPTPTVDMDRLAEIFQTTIRHRRSDFFLASIDWEKVYVDEDRDVLLCDQ